MKIADSNEQDRSGLPDPMSEPAAPHLTVEGEALRQFLRANPEARAFSFQPASIIGRLSALPFKIWLPPLIAGWAATIIVRLVIDLHAHQSSLRLTVASLSVATAALLLTRYPVLVIYDRVLWALNDRVLWLIHAPASRTPQRRLPWLMWCLLASLALAGVTAGNRTGGTSGQAFACAAAMMLLALVWPRFGALLKPVRVPLLIAVAYHIILQQDQSLETVRTTNESNLGPQIAAYLSWGYASVFLGWMLRILSVHAINRGAARNDPNAGWVPGVLFAAPLLSASYASWQAGVATAVGSTFIVACLVVAVFGIAFPVHKLSLAGSEEQDNGVSAGLFKDVWALGVIVLTLLLLPFSVASLGFDVEPPAAALVAGWLVVAAFAIVMVGRAGDLIRVPLVALLLGWALLLSWFDLNDNHEIAYRREQVHTPPPLANQAFKDWLASPQRRDRPLAFVVVAEGGGARAGYMTALAIEALRTQCSAFRRHHFASIGVSGGSVGAALSGGAPVLATAGPECTAINRFVANRSPAVVAMGSDLLGPTLRGSLFVDLPMRLWPGSLWRTGGDAAPNALQRPFGDRTTFLERRLGLAWAEQQGLTLYERAIFGGFLEPRVRPTWLHDRSFRDAWPGPAGNTPALILLATDVASGRRIGISHLRFWAVRHREATSCLDPTRLARAPLVARNRLLTLADIAPGRDPTLIGAAMVSARFPLITPAATLPCRGGEWRAVDGGYFENSGLTTALELVTALRTGGAGQNALKIVLIRIEGSDAITRPSSGSASGPPRPATSFAEVLSPLRAYGGTREARADQARQSVDEIENRWIGSGCATKAAPCAQVVQARLKLKACHVAIPLGWSLSEAAQADVRQQLGIEPSTDRCVRSAARDNLAQFAHIMKLATGSAPHSKNIVALNAP